MNIASSMPSQHLNSKGVLSSSNSFHRSDWECGKLTSNKRDIVPTLYLKQENKGGFGYLSLNFSMASDAKRRVSLAFSRTM